MSFANWGFHEFCLPLSVVCTPWLCVCCIWEYFCVAYSAMDVCVCGREAAMQMWDESKFMYRRCRQKKKKQISRRRMCTYRHNRRSDTNDKWMPFPEIEWKKNRQTNKHDSLDFDWECRGKRCKETKRLQLRCDRIDHWSFARNLIWDYVRSKKKVAFEQHVLDPHKRTLAHTHTVCCSKQQNVKMITSRRCGIHKHKLSVRN